MDSGLAPSSCTKMALAYGPEHAAADRVGMVMAVVLGGGGWESPCDAECVLLSVRVCQVVRDGRSPTLLKGPNSGLGLVAYQCQRRSSMMSRIQIRGSRVTNQMILHQTFNVCWITQMFPICMLHGQWWCYHCCSVTAPAFSSPKMAQSKTSLAQLFFPHPASVPRHCSC